jgi:hypothetical protein
MSIIPAPVYLIAIGVLTLGIGLQEVRVASTKAELANTARMWALDRANRTDLVRKLVEHNAETSARHAVQQQEMEDAFTKEKLALERRARSDADTARGLRAQLAAYTSRGSAGDQADPASCQRARDRLEALGGLFAEGVELVVEGRGIVERRDAEVKRLVDQITADRAAVEAAVTTR